MMSITSGAVNTLKFLSDSIAKRLVTKSHNVASFRALCAHRPREGNQNIYSVRSHNCGDLRVADVGRAVTLCGWLHYHRLSMFLILRDWNGLTQLVVKPDLSEKMRKSVDDLSLESVIQVTGVVKQRPEGQENTKMSTGEIEVEVDELKILNPSKPQLPVSMREFTKANESLRMEYRYLDLRSKQLQRNLRLRSELIMKMREFLCNKHAFVDVETPTLFRKTPGGAQEFLVPSRQAGQFYSLPQSPQQFKQLLMVGGIDRYMQVARCYRDEGSKPDRQPEFTQIDIEMSFTNQENILRLIEEMLHYSWPPSKGTLLLPFPRLTYDEAMRAYGTDKPDTRFEMRLNDISESLSGNNVQIFDAILRETEGSVQAMVVTSGAEQFSNKELEELENFAQEQNSQITVIKIKPDGSWQSPLSKGLSDDVKQQLRGDLGLKSGDLVLIAAGTGFTPHTLLGKLRLECARLLETKGFELRQKDSFNFLWVVDFPLFLPKEDGTEGFESAHHPFTAPKPEEEHLIYTEPHKLLSQHYDLVLNGNEVGGGSIRIHNSNMQRFVLEHVLKEDATQLEHLLTALDSGCPPHGGIAIGLDRLVSIICGAASIREVIAFPKSHDGKDLMSKAPASVSQQDLDLYHICVKT